VKRLKAVKSSIYLLLLSSCICVIALRPHFSGSAAYSTATLTVPDSYTSIQEAVDAAKEGDTVFISSGTYNEKIVINKTISLVGESSDNTIVDGGGSGTVVRIQADGVTVRGIAVGNGEVGFHINSSEDSTIEKTRISRNQFDGLRITDSNSTLIRDNMFSLHPQHGVFILRSNYSVLSNNTILGDSRMSVGVFVYQSRFNLIRSNNVTGNRSNEAGISILDSSDNEVRRNFIADNNWSGIDLRNANRNIITGNTIVGHNWFGIRISFSFENLVHLNNFIENSQQFSLESSNSTWNLNGLGNYWSNLSFRDDDPDGVFDVPYQMNENNTDHFPLAGRFYAFNPPELESDPPLSVISNSTVSEFTYAPQDGQTVTPMRFAVTAQDGSTGFCRITIPHRLLPKPHEITINELPPLMTREVASNASHTTLYFTYLHSTKQVEIVPELPSAILLALALASAYLVKLLQTKEAE
jgi:parallel beta-helix repeat protein